MKGINFEKLPKDPKLTESILDKTLQDNKNLREIGVLGRFFGSGDNVKLNIAGITISLLLVFGIVFTFLDYYNNKNGFEIWKIITPIITLSLGYIFGKNS